LLTLIEQGASASELYHYFREEGASDRDCWEIFQSIIDIVYFKYKSSSIEYNVCSDRIEFPSSIAWDITNKCNLRCKHCINSSGKDEVRAVSTDKCLDLVKQMEDMGVYLCWLGGGEPLLRSDCTRILRALKDAGIKTVLATNGIPCHGKPSLVDELSELCDEINISLDGATEQTHNFLRGRNSQYLKVVEIIRSFSENKGQTYVTAFACIHQRNLAEVEQMIDQAFELGVNKWMYNELSRVGRGAAMGALCLNRDQMGELREVLVRKEKQYEGRMYVSSYVRFQSGPPERFKRILYNCSAGIELMTVDYRGDVYPCFKMEYPEFLCGSVLHDTLSNIWKNAEPLQMIRNLDPQKSACWTCEKLQGMECNGGCLGEKYREHGSLYSLDPLCPLSGPC